MNADDLRALVAAPGTIAWKPLRELRGGGVVSCIDGRHRCCTVGAPGGNAGELIRLLTVLEWYGGFALEPATVTAILRAHVVGLGSFYLHTDVHAARRLARAVGVAPERAEDVLRRPPVVLRDRVRAALAHPDHVGCGHLRLLLEQPEEHRVRRELVEAVIVAFHELLWEGNAGLELAVLDGEHEEEALLVFHTAQPLDEATPVPTWCGTGGPRVFVTHVPVLRWLRQRMLDLVLETVPVERLQRLEPLDVLMELERLGERHLALAMGHLAPHLARYRLAFRDERVEVFGAAQQPPPRSPLRRPGLGG